MTSTDTKPTALAINRLIRLPEVMSRTGLARPTIYKAMAANRFPQVIRVGRAAMWVENEVDQWVADCINASRLGGAL